jgi:hypothetical protein
MGENIFYEIAALLLAAAVIGLLGTALRQPVVVSFIAVGIIAATLFQPSPHTVEQIDFFAELGVTLCCSSSGSSSTGGWCARSGRWRWRRGWARSASPQSSAS